MLTRHTDTLYYIITVYNGMFNHNDNVMRALAKKKTHWKKDFYFTIRFMPQKLARYYAKVAASTVMLLHSALILDPFLKL